MPNIEYWIQLENHAWDACPNGIDRMTGEQFVSVGTWSNRDMFKPLGSELPDKPLGHDALILRRYLPPTAPDFLDPWTSPDDRKVNPWDLNEPDPTEAGTKGTIPGPTIECSVGDSVTVHFRNRDMRTEKVFHPAVTHQVVHPAVTHVQISVVWKKVKVWFWYIWVPTLVRTIVVDKEEWTETVVDAEEFTTDELLSIEKRLHSLHTHGFVFDAKSDGAYPLSPVDPSQPLGAEEPLWTVIPEAGGQFFSGELKKGDRVPPEGTFIYDWDTIGWPTTAGVWLYHDHAVCDAENMSLGAIGIVVIHNTNDSRDVDIRLPGGELDQLLLPDGSPNGSPVDANNVYREPPSKALYLQLYHEMIGQPGMCINGRSFLGNAPTMVAGQNTLMRFGVVSMGNAYHTFHIHGHRWIIAGPDGTTDTANALDPNNVQNRASVMAVSQFEDTKILGAANSFAFTIDESATRNSFMRAEPAIGEWHMHCHVLDHMMSGMMGSLLVVVGGDPADPLPVGVPCPMHMEGMPGDGGGKAHQVSIENAGNNGFVPTVMNINVGDTVTWKNNDPLQHTATKTGGPGPNFDTGNLSQGATSAPITFNTAGTMTYRCDLHPNMTGTIQVT